ncbi:biotin carboxylase N-terminal domain-containing protein [Massilia sp. W12]|uniref:acetyl/propionyl/methylcrotonyl-CoA carboxylase subunit alpha n=1 Tax=Massilia sp. W12 TaxID=3126507 RepID=UPI0030D354F0
MSASVRPVHAVLIANRGEIALRIMRSVRAAGARALCVYSQADAEQAWWRAADAACCIGGATPAQSYLQADAMLAAARALGADALHPGYGFLAENPDFAQAVQDAGLLWIGAPPAAMRALGDKASAKRLLQGADLPLLPGYAGQRQDAAHLLEMAQQIGLPIMIKAAAGGGGRGMRKVSSMAALPGALRQAAAEAQQAFGRADLLLERALEAPRHIEVQIAVDAQGQIVDLGERECSIQRRHQKIMEESPAPDLSPELRNQLLACAHTLLQTAAARGCPYLGLGTLEFLFDGAQFYFMEMNARLQVEHTVTEQRLGEDLVAWQLQLAQGAPMPLSQAQITQRLAQGGVAMQLRLCAEDPQQDCLPQSGRVLHWRAPALRCDSALHTGDEISNYYDSLLAKLVAHGASRAQVQADLQRALRNLQLLGVRHNGALLQAILAHPACQRGALDTAWLEQMLAAWGQPAHTPQVLGAACAAYVLASQARYPAPGLAAPFSSTACLPVYWRFHLDQQNAASAAATAYRASLTWCDGVWRARIDSAAAQKEAPPPTVLQFAADGAQLQINGASHAFCWRSAGAQLWFALDGVSYCAEDAMAAVRSPAQSQNGDVLYAPFAARVQEICRQPGECLAAGDVIMVLEAMKMQHAVRAPAALRLEALLVGSGGQVASGAALARLQTREET